MSLHRETFTEFLNEHARTGIPVRILLLKKDPLITGFHLIAQCLRLFVLRTDRTGMVPFKSLLPPRLAAAIQTNKQQTHTFSCRRGTNTQLSLSTRVLI